VKRNIVNLLLSVGFLSAMPVWAQAPTKTYAQRLVELTAASHPELEVLAMHVTAPGSGDNTIIASNVPSILGHKSDEDDIRVMTTNVPLAAPAKKNNLFEVLVPLHDVSGRTIGTLGMVFRSKHADHGNNFTRSPYRNSLLGAGQGNEFLEIGTELRDQLQNIIPSIDTLFEPFIVAASPSDNLAMQLTIKMLSRHPDLWVLAFHVTPPGEKVNRIIAINVPKFLGATSEEVEEELSKNGNTLLEAFRKTHRVETHVPLRAVDGSLIGTLATVYLWQKETDTADMLARTIALRDELQKEIPNLASLMERPQ
jgi:hypothetical protein